MRILHVIPNLIKGGAQRMAIDLCNELLNYPKIQCRLLVLSKPKNDFEYCSQNLDIDYCEVEFKLSILKKNQINLSNYEHFIDEFNPEIIHTHLYFSELVCHEFPRINIKYVTHLHSNNIIYRKFNFQIFNKQTITNYYEKVRITSRYKKANKWFIAVSKFTGDYFHQNMNSYKRKLKIIPNGINLTSFQRKKVNLSNHLKIINVGALLKNKNHKLLIEIVKYLKNKNHNVQLEIIGEGPEKEYIEGLIKAKNLTNHIKLTGNVDKIDMYLSNSKFYIHTAKSEAFGLAIVEAMASKTLVISLSAGGNEEIIKNGKNGILIKKEEASIFGNKILQLINNKEKYKLIAEAGYNTSLNYDISICNKKLMKIYCK